MKRIMLAGFVFLSACSSPPEPPQVDWKKNPETMNSQLPQWNATYEVIKADRITSSWADEIRNFKPENRNYDAAVFYAVAHSSIIIVETSNSDDFFTTKNWLRSNGAYGLIQYRYRSSGLGIQSVSVYFQRS